MIQLRPYQEAGVQFLFNRRVALLADEMGIGKSAQAIRACSFSKAEKILVLCPASARINWQREFIKFTDDAFALVQVVFSAKMDFKTSWMILGGKPLEHSRGITVCSYDLTTNAALLKKLLAVEWDALILDEAHYLKTRTAKRTKAVFGKGGLIHKAKRTYALSGTPAPNNPSELWPMLTAFGVTKLPYWEFVQRYCTGHETNYGFQITGANRSRIPELKELLKPIMLRRKKEDVLKDLPPITYSDIVVEAGPVDEEIHFYDMWRLKNGSLETKLQAQKELVENVFKATKGPDQLKGLEALIQSVSTMRRYVGLQKLQSIINLVKDDFAGGMEKIVIFAVHRDVIEGLRVALAEFKPVTLYGGTPAEKRQANIDKFTTNPRCRVFIGNVTAAGTAINLTVAHHVLFAECSWVPAENAQAAMRCHRIGQEKPVTVRFAGLAGSIDERIQAVLRRKTADLTELFDKD